MRTYRHNEIVDAILNTPEEHFGQGGLGVLKYIAEKFPDLSEDDFAAAMDDAADEFEARAVKAEQESAALANLKPLFDGMPEGMSIGECARIKAERGDPLALSFIEWEKRQAGGVQ